MRLSAAVRLLLLALFSVYASAPLHAQQAAPSTGKTVWEDSLLPSAETPAGTPLKDHSLKDGTAKWVAPKDVTIEERGATTTSPNGAHFAVKSIAGLLKVEADVDATGSGFAGLALGRGNLTENFWVNLAVLIHLNGGDCNVMVGSKNLIEKPDKSLLKPGFNHLELGIDTIARTITARVNGKTLLDAVPLPASARVSDISAIGFRFNEPLKAGSPSIKNFRAEAESKASSGLELTDYSSTFVVPDVESSIAWRVGNPGPGGEIPYQLHDYSGEKIDAGKLQFAADGTVALKRKFSRGYVEINFPDAGQTFGIVALEPVEGVADPFFGIDAGLSWLEGNATRREGLVKILARSGIGMARERLGLSNINPAKGKYLWEGNRAFDTLRKSYAQNDVKILEILDGGGKYLTSPFDYAGLAEACGAMAKHWPAWGAAEGNNEPDLKSVPADQYAPQVKAMAYGLREAGMTTPMVIGAFATIPPGPFFDSCQRNGLLEIADAVSLHSYDRAPDVQAMVSRYRFWLRLANKEAMPLWHTECGWAWPQGTDRPGAPEDRASAMEISAKAVESMACGIAKYFPFVYVFYEEGKKNFGMMGREASPLRSMAAYAACAQTLSGLDYLGDIDLGNAAVKRARVFGKTGAKEAVVVLYTGKTDAEEKLAIPFNVNRIASADGRFLPTDKSITISDGLAYIWTDFAALKSSLKTDAAVAKLYATGQKPLVPKREKQSPIDLQFEPEKLPSRVSARGYLVTYEVAQKLPIHVRIHNMSGSSMDFTPSIKLPGKPTLYAAKQTIPARGVGNVSWTLDATSALDLSETRFITIAGDNSGPTTVLPLAIGVVMEGRLEDHLKKHKTQMPLPIDELGAWTANIAGHGKSKFSALPENGWRLNVNFAPGGGNWTYPRFALKQAIDPKKLSGILLRARILQPASNIAIIAGSGDHVPTFWVTDIFPADGEWHAVYIPFAEFKPGPNSTGNQNTRLDPAAWKSLSIGMATKPTENALEISHLMLVGE